MQRLLLITLIVGLGLSWAMPFRGPACCDGDSPFAVRHTKPCCDGGKADCCWEAETQSPALLGTAVELPPLAPMHGTPPSVALACGPVAPLLPSVGQPGPAPGRPTRPPLPLVTLALLRV